MLLSFAIDGASIPREVPSDIYLTRDVMQVTLAGMLSTVTSTAPVYTRGFMWFSTLKVKSKGPAARMRGS